MKFGLAIAGAVLALLCAPVCDAQENRIVSLGGSAAVRRAREAGRTLALNDVVMPGDEISTGADGEVTVRMGDGTSIHIFPASRVVVEEQSRDFQEFLHLFFGSIKVRIEKLGGRPNPHSLTTPTAVIAVRGTAFSVFIDEDDATLVAVDEGIVAVTARGMPATEVTLLRGQRCWVRRGQPPTRAEAFRGQSERADLIPPRPRPKREAAAPKGVPAAAVRLPRRLRQNPWR